VQTPCPFCIGNEGFHLGYNTSKGYFHCWRCGAHSIEEAIPKILHISYYQLKGLLRPYKTHFIAVEDVPVTKQAKVCKLPAGCLPLEKPHKNYLKKRKFDPDVVASTWDLYGTGWLGEYKFRIIAPIYFQHELVSYQGRDYTGHSKDRYKTCAKYNEVIFHKHVLYGIDKVPGERIVICEGITDVWRLGAGAVCTFGIQFKMRQVKLMKIFKERFILFDTADAQAREQADKLARLLAVYPGETTVLELPYKDPGEMPQKKADRLMEKELQIR
jgi:hypothetical protein